MSLQVAYFLFLQALICLTVSYFFSKVSQILPKLLLKCAKIAKFMPNLGKITLIQLDGILTPDEFKKCVELGIQGCKQVYEIQKKALREKYFSNEGNS